MENSNVLHLEKKENEYLAKPDLLRRIKSLLIDSVVIVVLMFLAFFILNSFKIESGLIKGIALGLILLYEPILVCIDRTIGQHVMGLRVVKARPFIESNKRIQISFIYSILRYIVKAILGVISLVTIHKDLYGKGIHDMLVESVMIDENIK